jgi:16S rRNA (cytosine1407-C5)-methyltransferase
MVDTAPNRLRESLQRFSGILTEAEMDQIIAIQSEPLPTGIRINPLKSDPDTAILDLSARYGWQVKPVPFCDNAWIIQAAEVPPGKTIEHRLGQFYLQDAASIVPVSLFDIPSPGLLILDMAASPGGKTTHLIDRTGDNGFILANDASQNRIPALRSVLSAWGGINQIVTNFPGEAFGNWFPETFDMILLDAPCSMENLRPTPAHPLRETTHDERLRLQDRQVQLLFSGLKALKVGGQLVYGTCSLAPEEDEAVLDQANHAYPGAFIIDDVSGKVPFQAPGLTTYAEQTYDPFLAHALRLWPHLTGMSGFFCARINKVHPIATVPEPPPSRDFARTLLKPAKRAFQEQIFEQLSAYYGFDLENILQKHSVKLYLRHTGVFLLPEVYLNRFNTLPFEFIGMQLGQWRQETLQPSREFFSRFGHLFTRGRIQIKEEQAEQWIAGRDIRHPETSLTPQGQYLLVLDADGSNLGMGKLLPKRLRNMLPRTSI